MERSAMALPHMHQNNVYTELESFRKAMLENGLVPPTEIVADGKFHRFSTNGKPSDDAGWYVLNEYPIAVGSFGCWRSGLKGSWSAIEERNMTQEDRTKYNRAIQQMSQVNDEEKAKANLEAAVIAEQLWDQANDVSSAHPYLVSKKVDAFGIKHNGQKILIPIRDLRVIKGF